MKSIHLPIVILISSLLFACESTNSDNENSGNEISTNVESATITEVSINGEPGSYRFLVTVASPDTGCSQYADWWEVVRTDGSLVYRRILTHSHVDEQPFTRSGGPVDVAADEDVFVRAHMNSVGYGDQVFSGSVAQGLVLDSLDSSFAEELEIADPLPGGCAF